MKLHTMPSACSPGSICRLSRTLAVFGKDGLRSRLLLVGLAILSLWNTPAISAEDVLSKKMGYPSFYTGEVLPKPQKVLGEWSSLSLDPAKTVIDLSGSQETLTFAKKLLLDRIAEAGKDSQVGSAAQKVRIIIGLIDSALIKGANQRLNLGLADVASKPEGYAIRVVSADGLTTIYAAGADIRGAFYGAMTIRQLIGAEGGKLSVRAANLNDWPEWAHRYASDYFPPGPESVAYLAMNKINGYAIQHRYEWRDFDADTEQSWGGGAVSTYKMKLEALNEFKKRTGLMDYMLVMNIYADRKQEWFDISNDKHIADLIERCKFAAKNGIDHIMICVDDWTPSEDGRYVCPHPTERKKFADSVGRAHGYLMTKLHDALSKQWPNLELSIAPPVYSLLDHNAESADASAYLRDLNEGLPKEVMIIWTGPRVVNKANSQIVKEDYVRFSKLVNGHSLLYWDNGEGTNPPIPYWNVSAYDGFAQDNSGIVFLNLHTFGWPWSLPYTLNQNDYFWNPKGFDVRRSFELSVEELYGPKAFPVVEKFIKDYELLQGTLSETNERERALREEYELKKAWDKREKVTDLGAQEALAKQLEDQQQADAQRPLELIGKLEEHLKEFKELGLPDAQPAAAVKLLKAEVTVKVPSLSIPKFANPPALDGTLDDPEWKNAGQFVLSPIKGEKTTLPLATGKIGYNDSTLFLAFTVPYEGELAIPPFKDKHDDAVYSSPDAIEIIIQPSPGGNYLHFVVDHMGNTFDQMSQNGPGGWNPGWNAKVMKKPGEWIAELSIPFSSLTDIMGTPPIPGTVWRGQFGRAYNAKNEIFVWSPTSGASFHNPAFWGKLKFGE